MTTFVEDFSTWGVEALIRVPPESLEAADLMALVIELQNRLFKEFAETYLQEHRKEGTRL